MPRKIHQKKAGFTLIELLVVVAIIAVLAALALPALRSAQAQSLAVKCASNMQQLGKATLLYAQENEMCLPDSSHGIESWTNSLQPYAGGTLTFKCPADEVKGRARTFVINDYLTSRPCNAEFLSELNQGRLVCVEKPSQTVFLLELSKDYGTNNPPDHLHLAQYYPEQIPASDFASQVGVQRHPGKKANYVFADAHCESLSWTEAQARMAEPGSRFITSIPTE